MSAQERPHDAGPAWWAVALAAAPVATVCDLVLLQRKYTILTGGFLNPVHLQGAGILLFLLASLWADAALIGILAPAALALARRAAAGTLQRVAVAGTLAVAPLLALTIADYRVHHYLGDMLQYRLGLSAWAGENAPLLGALTLVAAAALGLGVVLGVLRLLRAGRVSLLAGCTRPRGRGWIAWALLVPAAPAAMALLGLHSEAVDVQLRRKVSSRLLLSIAHAATDVDGDGYGWARWPRDFAPWDERRHPYAVDLPANGIDENGVGGDLPQAGEPPEAPPTAPMRQRPDFLLVVLESFRADNLGAEVEGRPVTPVLRDLLARGAVTGPAYSHSGFTVPSLVHLFTGDLQGTRRSSLVDDFRDNGYLTACVSGEDESFDGIAARTGLDRCEIYRDARDFLDRRTGPSTSPGDLTLPWPVVVEEVDAVLAAAAGQTRPLFLYVNFQDCHFPYRHGGLEPIVPCARLSREKMVPGRRDAVRRNYLNAAANVDRAVGRVLDAFGRRRGRPPALLLLGDHGEELYDEGALGHGVRINRAQLEILFLVDGFGARCVFPLGQREVRRMVLEGLAGDAIEPTWRIDPDKSVFLYTGGIRTPGEIGAAFAAGGLRYRFRDGSCAQWGAAPGDPAARLADCIHRWERLALAQARALAEVK